MRRLLLAAIVLAGCRSRADVMQVTPWRATLLITLPGHSDPSIEVMFPEHVTAVRHGGDQAEHLYLNGPGDAPAWRRSSNVFQYERDLRRDIHMLARATLESDGVLFHYELTNRSDVAYDMIVAVTDPRLRGEF